jgi:hypothetical protein
MDVSADELTPGFEWMTGHCVPFWLLFTGEAQRKVTERHRLHAVRCSSARMPVW